MTNLLIIALSAALLASASCSDSTKQPLAQTPMTPAPESSPAMVHAPETLADWAKGA